MIARESMIVVNARALLDTNKRRHWPVALLAMHLALTVILASCASVPVSSNDAEPTSGAVMAVSSEALRAMQDAEAASQQQLPVAAPSAPEKVPLALGVTRVVEGALEAALEDIAEGAPLPRLLVVAPVIEDDWRPSSFAASRVRTQSVAHLRRAFSALSVSVDYLDIPSADWLLGLGLKYENAGWAVCARVIDLRQARRFEARSHPVTAASVDWSPQPYARERPVLPRPLPRAMGEHPCAVPEVETLPAGVRSNLIGAWFALVEGQDRYAAGDWQGALDAFRNVSAQISSIGLAATAGAASASATRDWLDAEASIGRSLAYGRVGAPVRAARAREAFIDSQLRGNGEMMLNLGLSPLDTSAWLPDRLKVRNEAWVDSIGKWLARGARCARITSYSPPGAAEGDVVSLASAHSRWFAEQLVQATLQSVLTIEPKVTNDRAWPADLVVGDVRDEWQRRLLVEVVTNYCY